MLETIKSDFIKTIIIEYIENKKKLEIFKYNHFYQNKFNIKIIDYICEFYKKASKHFVNSIYKVDSDFKSTENYILESLKKKLSHNISNDILKETIIKYFANIEDYCFSINHIYFDEIIKERIKIGKNNIKINFDIKEYLSQNDIINLIVQKKSKDKINDYINKKVNLNNNLINNLEILLNSSVIINEIYFNLKNEDLCYVDMEKDKIEYDQNENDEKKNILINYKLKGGDLINKILEKNSIYIEKMKYLVFEQKSIKGIKLLFPLIDLERFVNLNYLDLFILYKGSLDEELFYNFTNKLHKLKHLIINGEAIDNDNYILNIYLKKEIINNLEILKIKNCNWTIQEKESFDLKNIIKLHINNCILPEHNNVQIKYFIKELLNGNVIWEKLEKLKISTYFCFIPEAKEKFKNEKILDFFKVSSMREEYEDASSEFFPHFFNFFFKNINNQNIFIETHNYNKNIEKFKIKIYDIIGCGTCQKKPIVYEKIGKNVNITVGGRLYGEPVYSYNTIQESPLKYINFDNVKIDPCLDSFTIDYHTINELKVIKKLIPEEIKKCENIRNKYKKLYEEIINIHKKILTSFFFNYNENKIENILIELKNKKQLLNNQLKINYNKIDKKNNYDKTVSIIKNYVFQEESSQIKKLIPKIEDMQKYVKKININNRNNKNKIEEKDNDIDDLGSLFD